MNQVYKLKWFISQFKIRIDCGIVVLRWLSELISETQINMILVGKDFNLLYTVKMLNVSR